MKSEKFELQEIENYTYENVVNFIAPYFSFLALIKPNLNDVLNYSIDTIDSSPLSISPGKLASHDYEHTYQGYLPNKYGDGVNTHFKIFLDKNDADSMEYYYNFMIIFCDYVDSFVDIADPIIDLDLLDRCAKRGELGWHPEVYLTLSKKEKEFIVYNTIQRRRESKKAVTEGVGYFAFIKKLRIYVREKNRNQMFGHNLHEINLKLTGIVLPKILSGEYKDWVEGLTNPDCQLVMQEIADLNEEFRIGSNKIKNNEKYSDRFDVENSLSDKDMKRILVKSEIFNNEVDSFIKELCSEKEAWMCWSMLIKTIDELKVL
jgi:hypothetical protein